MTSELIHEAFNFPTVENYVKFTDTSLRSNYCQLSKENRENLFKLFLPTNSQLPSSVETYPISLFYEDAQSILAIILSLLSEDDIGTINHEALGFLIIMLQPNNVVDISSYLVKSINFQFKSFQLYGYFRHPSILVHF